MTFAQRALAQAEKAQADGYTQMRIMVAHKDWPPTWPEIEFKALEGMRTSYLVASDGEKTRIYPLEDQ